jgi:exopolyphosphatase/guanosine-5'-triphosphate,3'-diphosphate pyrophosphatase
MQKSVDVIDGYLSLCRDEGVEEIVAIGTSTLREASNRSHFLETVRRRCGVEIEIISGQEEARLAHLAVARDRKWPPGPLVVIDIGGGSTEWIHGETGGEVRVFTMCIGSVRLTEQFIASDPVNEDEYLAMVSHVRRLLEALPPLAAHALLVGIGGTIATLFSVKEGLREFQPSRIHHGLLELKDIEEQIQQFKSLPLRQRRAIAAEPPYSCIPCCDWDRIEYGSAAMVSGMGCSLTDSSRGPHSGLSDRLHSRSFLILICRISVTC